MIVLIVTNTTIIIIDRSVLYQRIILLHCCECQQAALEAEVDDAFAAQ